MPDRRISDLPELVSPADADWLVVVDVDDLSQSPQGTTKKLAKVNLGVGAGPHTHVAADITDLAGLLAAKADTSDARFPAGADIVDSDVAAANKDGTAGTPSMRTLGTGAQQAAAGTDSRFPTTDEKAALAGTHGTPSTSNRYVTQDIIDAKGDIVVGTASNTITRKAIGSTYYALIADPAEATGLKWQKLPIYNVEHYGMVPGGAAGANVTGWDAAVAAVPASGGVVVIPDGNFPINALLNVPSKVKVWHIGELDLTTSAACVFQFGDGSGQRLDQELFGGGAIYCNRLATDAIKIDCCRNGEFRSSVVYDPTNSAVLVQNTNSGGVQLDCDTHIFAGITMKANGGSSNFHATQRPARFMVFDGSGTYLVTDCQVIACTALGGMLPTSFSGTTDPMNGGIGIEVKNADRITFTDPRIYSHVHGAVGGTSLGTATVTIASPAVVTRTAHGLANDDPVYFTTTGALPTGITHRQVYFARNVTANTFELAATAGGASINTSGTQSGTHTLFDGGAHACHSRAMWIHATSGNTANGNTINGLYCEADPSSGTTSTDWRFDLIKIEAETGGTCEYNQATGANQSVSASATNKRFWLLVNNGTAVRYNHYLFPKLFIGNAVQVEIGTGCVNNLVHVLGTESITNNGGTTNTRWPLTNLSTVVSPFDFNHAVWDEDVREVVTPSVRVFNNGALTIPTNATTQLTFDSERWDNDGMHSTATNTGRLTANRAGKYSVYASIQWASNTTSRRTIVLRKNGTTIFSSLTSHPIQDGTGTRQNVSGTVELAATDYVDCAVLQITGADLDVQLAAQYSPEFGMDFVTA